MGNLIQRIVCELGTHAISNNNLRPHQWALSQRNRREEGADWLLGVVAHDSLEILYILYNSLVCNYSGTFTL